MGLIHQPSATAANSSSLTLSTWVRCPSNGVSDVFDLIEFGSEAEYNDMAGSIGTNGIAFISDPANGGVIINLHGVPNTIDMTASVTGTDPALVRLNNPPNNWGNVWTA